MVWQEVHGLAGTPAGRSGSGPKHRNSGNVLVPRLATESLSTSTASPFGVRERRVGGPEMFDMGTPALATPRINSPKGPLPSLPVSLTGFLERLREPRHRIILGISALIATLCWWLLRWEGGAELDGHVAQSQFALLDQLYEQKLRSIASGVTSLESLGQIVVKAEETYEDVYHNQLVQHAKDSRDPNEVDWNGFVREARFTGPVFLAGKEKLREAVANMQRLIRRAPEYLRSMVQWLSKRNAEEASWYLSKVVKLVDSVHSSMAEAAERFAEAEATIDGMTRDAKENADRFEHKATSLEGEVKALEGTSSASTGRWEKSLSHALYGCQIEKSRASLAECKMKCIEHASGSCNRLTYYKTTSGNNCYLHCESAASSSYHEADTHVLERAPSELALDMTQKTEAAVVAVGLKARWQGVQSPLREVTRLVRRFRAATADLRGSLEDARFATDDLLAAFNSTAPLPEPGTDKQLRMLERRVEDVVSAIEDLGDSLAILRFQ